MKYTLSFVLLSALVLAATANEIQDVSAFLDGFSKGMNVTDPALGSCRTAVENATMSYGAAIELIEALKDGAAIENAVGNFGFQLAHSIRVCGNVYKDMADLLKTIGDDLIHINTTAVYHRLFANMFNLNMKFQQAKAAYAQADFETVGEVFASVYKMILYGHDSTRTIRQLSMFTNLTQEAAVNFNATYLGFLGFIEEANTTVDVHHFVSFSNDTSSMVALTVTLEAAIQKMDLPTIISTIQSLNNALMIVAADFKILSADVTNFVERDLPLFESAAQVEKIGQYLFANIPTTMMNMQRINNAYKTGDFRELGHGTGALYNEARAGAMSSF